MDNDTQQTTLRDALAASYDKVAEEAPDTSVAPAAAPVQPELPIESAEEKAARVRDEKGRFAPHDKEKQDARQVPGNTAAQQQGAEAPQQKPRPQRPSTWKKEYWDHWDKIDPTLAEYLVQREGEYAKGVSTYKNEWEQARPLMEAVSPFQPLLQQHGIAPQEWIRSLGYAQQVLATGTPQQKLQMFQTLANQYQIPLHELLQGHAAQQQQVGPDGQPVAPSYDPRVNMLQQQLQQSQQQWQQLSQSWNSFQTEQQKAAQAAIDGEINAFKGTVNAEHFEQVRETMAGLLQAGLATDLPSAFDKACRMHDDIWQQQLAAKETERRASADKAAKQAKQAGASTRTATPSAAAPAGKDGKNLRETIAAAYDASAPGGRI